MVSNARLNLKNIHTFLQFRYSFVRFIQNILDGCGGLPVLVLDHGLYPRQLAEVEVPLCLERGQAQPELQQLQAEALQRGEVLLARAGGPPPEACTCSGHPANTVCPLAYFPSWRVLRDSACTRPAWPAASARAWPAPRPGGRTEAGLPAH